jgi:hypothetical protein
MSLALPVGLLVAAVLCAIAIVGTLLDRWAAGHDAETTRRDESTHDS